MSTHAAWVQPQLAAQVLRTRRDGHSEIALRVEGLHNAQQVLRLEQLIHGLPGVQRVAIDAPAKRVRVVWDRQHTSLPVLLEAFTGARCRAQPLRHDSIDDARSRESHDALKRLLVAGMFAMQVMTYAFVIYIGVVDFVDFTTRGLFRWLSLLSAVPVVFYSAKPFYVGALRELRRHQLGINLSVTLAVLLVFLASTINTLRGSGDIYFDSVSMFVFLLLAARYVELRARHRSGALGDAVIDAAPLLAERRHADGSLETVAAIELVAGDHVHIAEGTTVPADGVLESAMAEVDEALLSGESLHVQRQRGERLIAGSMLLVGPAELLVEHTGEATAAARLSALSTRTRKARMVSAPGGEREVGRFIGRVLLLTALTALGWMLVDPARAFEAAVAVLVVACPCSFALTRPATLTRALGVLAGHGVLVTDSSALATLARVDYALFDKTGTLSVPQLATAAIEPLRGDDPDDVLQLAAALAHESSHPLARALASTARQRGLPQRAQAVEVSAGAGISGEVDGRPLRLGRADFALAPSGHMVSASLSNALLLADQNGPIAAFHLDEQPRKDARRTLDALRADGIALVIASGDSKSRVAALAARLDIHDAYGRQSPTDKLQRLQAARQRDHVTLAVGDGSNDAPVLAGADVSAALGSGTELAQAHADLLLLDGGLDGLVQARSIARQVALVVAQSRRWSLVYNLCAVPFAALGFVPPWLAAIGMSLSSLAVVLNALRVGRDSVSEPTAKQREMRV
ncbi:heavy metal translocating P-type ATPase [Rhodanobacter sp. C01]|uniref:heavy metal translocating P-type ATPase n=1 Tax=Rhodanobacter sp. C01 TaxID=1945856 RepID=UPI000984DEC8|nr:heavy metal translocating P-type ATPase [Rhodanobacter sp. C01]OOG50129.1 ATPase P [Rhodanobacter sp. C01]